MKLPHISASIVKQAILILILGLWTSCSPKPSDADNEASLRIIPEPNSVVMADGKFRMTEKTSIEADDEFLAQAELLRGFLSPASGYALPLNTQGSGENSIQLRLAKESIPAGDEGYELRVTPDRVIITASTSRGIVWGIQTMRQLLPKGDTARFAGRGWWNGLFPASRSSTLRGSRGEG